MINKEQYKALGDYHLIKKLDKEGSETVFGTAVKEFESVGLGLVVLAPHSTPTAEERKIYFDLQNSQKVRIDQEEYYITHKNYIYLEKYDNA